MKTRRLFLVALLSLTTAACGAPSRAQAPQPLTQPLDIVTQRGTVHLQVEVVDTPESRERGLMYRTYLAPNAGMLFDFKQSQQVAFWMKNTFIPLDMLFIDEHGHIANIARQATPQSEEAIPSAGPVLGVLEIGGGRADAMGIETGDLVKHPLFH